MTYPFGRVIILDPHRAWNLAGKILVLQKRMGPGALEHRGAQHLRLCEGFLVHTSTISGSDSAWPLRSSPVNVFQIVEGAMRLAAAYDLNCVWTLR